MNKYFWKALMIVSEAMMIAEDGVIDEAEEKRIEDMLAPLLAEAFEDDIAEDVNDMQLVRIAVNTIQKTIKLIQQNNATN